MQGAWRAKNATEDDGNRNGLVEGNGEARPHRDAGEAGVEVLRYHRVL